MNTAKVVTLAAFGLGAAPVPPSAAETPASPPKIGLIGDFQSVYSDIGGTGNVEAAKMAIEEFGGTMFGKSIELISVRSRTVAAR
jgi:branched-chain amino acid transport system substrate-binding protein